MSQRYRYWSPLSMLMLAALLVSLVNQSMPGAKAAAAALPLLDDSSFVYTPEFDDAAIQAFLEGQSGHLSTYQATLDGAAAPAAHVIAVAGLGTPNEVSPRVLLALLEVSSGLVTTTNPPATTLRRPFGLMSESEATFESELLAMGALLREHFAEYDLAAAPRITLADGSSYQRPPLPNAATYALEVALGRLAPDAASFELLIGDGSGSFQATFRALFGDPAMTVQQAIPQGSVPFLYKPFAGGFRAGSFLDHDRRAGVFMRFDGTSAGGYDGHDGTDFPMAPGNTVLAAADGIVVDVAVNRTEGSPPAHPSWCPSWASYTPVTGMVVRHNVSGVEYKTTYWHLSSGTIGTNPRTGQPYGPGEEIKRGEVVGLSGNTGCSTGAHLHFGVSRSGLATDPYGWCGASNDPYPNPSTNIWLETMTNPSPCPRSATDTTPPTVNPTVAGTTGANGWYTSPAQVSWSLADPESGIASSQGCETVTLSQDTAGASITCVATNGAGLSQSGSVSLKIDATPPTINLSFDRPYYTRLETATLRLSAADSQPGSGLAHLEASFDNTPAQDGQQLDLFWRSLGAATVTATASDNAGLVTTRTASFELIATCESLAKTITALRQRAEIDGDTAAHDLLVIVGRAIAAWQRGENDAAIRHLTDLEDAITARSAQISERATALLLGDTAYIKIHLPPVDGLPEPPAPPRNLTVRSGRTTLLTWEPSPSEWSHGYLVYRKGAGESDFTRVTVVPLEGLTYSDTGVAEGVSYTYYVTAIDEYGRESLPSNSERAFAGHLQLKLPTVRAAPGMTVRVPVQAEYADGLCLEAADVGIAYDPAVATPVGVSRSTLTDSYSFAHAVRKAGEVHISAVGPCSTLYGAGALFWVNFTVAPTATVQSSLDFIEGLTGTTLYDSADLAQPIPLSLSNGAIVVDAARPQLRGDLNGDGVINAADAALALRITVGLLKPNADQQITGDVNADGSITAADATLILYYAAHQQWPESLAAPAAALRVAQSLRYQVRPEMTMGAVGAEVRVPLTIDDGTGLAGSTVLLQYGPGLIFQGAVLNSDLEQRGFTLAVNGASDGEARLSLAGSEGLGAGEQRLIWVRFKVADGATNQTTWMKAAGVWLNDLAGRDFSTTGSRPIVVGGRGSVTLSAMPLRVFLPLIQR